uniref:SYO1-like TPR repeats domain-containing protein n=1 Tax=Corethrella appendiculata TaxID=1370023 RepID=U5ENR9_9DIPT
MGKAKKARSHTKNTNPIGGQTNSGSVTKTTTIEDELETNSSNSPIYVIVEQLQSAAAEDKLCGLQTLSTVCQNTRNIEAILESDLIRIAASLLVDPDTSIRHSTAGALRNLSIISIEICEFMVEQDVLTPLLALLNSYTTTDWHPIFDKTLQNQMDEKSDTFLQAVNLVWNLCESTALALNCFNQTQLLQSFVKCLNWEVYGLDIAIAVAQCLLVISEDNSVAWKILVNYGNELSTLLSLEGNHQNTILRTVSAGILANVPALSATYLNAIIIALGKTLDVDHRSVLCNLTSTLPLLNQKDVLELEVTDDVQFDDESEADGNVRRRKDDLPNEIELEVKHVGWLLLAQRIAAEILTNVCSNDDDEWKDEMDDENLSDAESVNDYDADACKENVINSDRLPVEILEAIKSLSIVEKLWKKVQPLPENVLQILRENEKNLLKRVTSLKVSSLLCLHNLCISISTEDLGGPEALYNVWIDLGQQVFQGDQDVKTLEASTSLMRAALEHLRKSADLFKQMSNSDLQLMLSGVQNCQDAEIRANWLRMLGILGCLLPEHLVKNITEFILNTCLKEEEIWTLSEATDALMDIFSDNDWLKIIYDLNMVLKCKELEKILKTKTKQSKRELNDRYPAVCTVKTNLSRFCKYLEGLMRNYTPQHIET